MLIIVERYREIARNDQRCPLARLSRMCMMEGSVQWVPEGGTFDTCGEAACPRLREEGHIPVEGACVLDTGTCGTCPGWKEAWAKFRWEPG